jgi:hypothetical protein
VCCCSNVASLTISRHQTYITYNKIKYPTEANWPPPKNLFIYNTAPEVMKNAPKEATNGQGLGSTKCQLCFVFKYLKSFLFWASSRACLNASFKFHFGGNTPMFL